MVKLECKVSVFKNLIEAVANIVSEVVLVFSNKGVKMQCMDPNHVGLVMLSLPKSTFQRYKCDAEEKIGLSLATLLKILKVAGISDDCCMSTEDADPDTVDIKFINNDRTFEYNMKLLDLQYDAIQIPDRDDNAVIMFPSKEFQAIIKDLSALGDEVTITANEDSIGFSIESDNGKGSYTLEYKDEGVECVEFEEKLSQLFAIKYLNSFSKACSFCDKVELRMKDEQPLAIRFPLPKMSNCLIDLNDDQSHGILLFFLAPKIEDN